MLAVSGEAVNCHGHPWRKRDGVLNSFAPEKRLPYPSDGNVFQRPDFEAIRNIEEGRKAQTDSIEVIISDSRMISRGSQFGHVAIVVDGVAYSRAHSIYATMPYKEYIAAQMAWRNSIGYVLRVSLDEKNKIETELKRRVTITTQDPGNHKYDILSNSCSSNVADVLDMVGIVAYDPRGFGVVSPSDLAVGLPRSKRLAEKRDYPKK
jgi:hypothetical protein